MKQPKQSGNLPLGHPVLWAPDKNGSKNQEKWGPWTNLRASIGNRIGQKHHWVLMVPSMVQYCSIETTIQLHDLWKMLTFETSCLHGDIINVNPDHFVHITASARPHGAVKNCSLFELVKTNNQDQRKGDKIKPEPRAESRASGTDWLLGALFICGLRFGENIHHHPRQPP